MFQDEELLFSQTQQKDNDPDVDLFATSGKAAVSLFRYLSLCVYVFFPHLKLKTHDHVYFSEPQAQLSEAGSTKSVCR